MIETLERKVKVGGLNEFPLEVDYVQTFQQLMNAGNYYQKNRIITESNFPLPSELARKRVRVVARLFNFSDWRVIQRINKAGYYVSNLVELLAVGAVYPDLQRQFSIVALGAVWWDFAGLSSHPCLNMIDGERGLDLWVFDEKNLDYRFLAIKKGPLLSN